MTEAQARQRIEKLSREIDEHNYKYYVQDNPAISDFEFDKMLDELIKLEKEFPQFASPDSPTQRVGGAITKVFKAVKVPLEQMELRVLLEHKAYKVSQVLKAQQVLKAL